MAIVLWGTATSELSAVVTGPSGPLVSGPRPGRLTAANRIALEGAQAVAKRTRSCRVAPPGRPGPRGP